MKWTIDEIPDVRPGVHDVNRAAVDITSGPLCISLSPGRAGELANSIRIAVANAQLAAEFFAMEANGNQEITPRLETGRAFLCDTEHPRGERQCLLWWPSGELTPRRLWLTSDELVAWRVPEEP